MTKKVTLQELRVLGHFVFGVRALLKLSPESVGRIADYVGQYGIGGDVPECSVLEDGVLTECLKVIVDAVNRRK
jgi:hypothetical protein